MSKTLTWTGLFAVIAILGGCGPMPSVKAVTVVHRDGSFDRTLNYSELPSQGESRTKIIRDLNKTFQIQDAARFRWPKPHPSSEAQLVFHRHYVAGSHAKHDVKVLSTAGKRLVTNEAWTRPLSKGTWIFTERYHWTGRPISDSDFLDGDFRQETKKALGPSATTAEIDRLAERALKDYLWNIVAPNKFDSLPTSNSDATNEKLLHSTEKMMVAQAQSTEEREASHRLAARLTTLILKPPKNHKNPSPARIEHMDLPFANIAVQVDVPGTIVKTDGLRPSSRVVTWNFWSAALAEKDVVLSVVYRPESP